MKAVSGIVLLAVHRVVKYLPTAFDWLGNRPLEVYSGMRIRPFTFCYNVNNFFVDYRAFVTQLKNNDGIREQGAEEDIWA